jgi:hypothetical protein
MSDRVGESSSIAVGNRVKYSLEKHKFTSEGVRTDNFTHLPGPEILMGIRSFDTGQAPESPASVAHLPSFKVR